MSQKRPIFYDTETTGIRESDKIIELAAYDPVRDATFEEFINPGIPIPPDATAIHNITDEMVKDAGAFGEVIVRFFDFCSGGGVLIAHNNDSFDLPFLKRECLRAEVAFPPFETLDSLKWARRYRRDLPKHTLQFLREIYGFPANNAHRALDDVIVLHQVFTAMTDDLTVDEVMNLLSKPKPLGNKMPFGKHQGKPLDKVPSSYVQWLAKSGFFDKPENAELKESFATLGMLSVR